MRAVQCGGLRLLREPRQNTAPSRLNAEQRHETALRVDGGDRGSVSDVQAVELLAVRQIPRLVVRGVEDGEQAGDDLGGRSKEGWGGCVLARGDESIQGDRGIVVDRERANTRAAQRREVPTDAEGGAEVAGERADVGARRAIDDRVNVDGITGSTNVEHVEARDGDATRGQRDLLARAHSIVRAATVDLDRADRARHLVELAGEGGDRGGDAVVGGGGERGGRRSLADRVTLGVIGRRSEPEADRRRVLLVETHEIGEQARRRARAQRQQAGGRGIEGASVAHLAGAQRATGASDHVVAGEAGRLVDEQQAGDHRVNATGST